NNIKDFIINAGGDIFAQGRKHSKNWRIAIENPFYADKSSNRIISQIQLSEPMSVFTSGNYHRFYSDENNIKRHHIIAPVTGEPSINISAITVLHQNPITADVAVTTLMLAPIPELKNMANKLEIKDFLAISDNRSRISVNLMIQKIQWSETMQFQTHLLSP
ncbi:MAG: FAD:protein FMN transferase, partial [Gammaproteobacteria bacterium]|nr:FAD:protein FMN transferase [Gammaproteobacteria bacterium]